MQKKLYYNASGTSNQFGKFLIKIKQYREYNATGEKKKAQFFNVTNKPDILLTWCVYYDEFRE